MSLDTKPINNGETAPKCENFSYCCRDAVGRSWSQIKDFVQTNKKNILIALLISGIAILSFSLGGAIAASLSASIQVTQLNTYMTTMTRAGWIVIGGLISAIVGTAMASFSAGVLLTQRNAE